MKNRKNLWRLLPILVVSVLCFVGCNVSDEGVEYSDINNWAYLAANIEEDIDVFIIAPTVDMGHEDKFNMSLDDEETKEAFVGALNMQLGIYNEECNVFAPYYRQMTLSGYSDENYENHLDIAYQDIASAFKYYFENENQGRPFVLAGFSQGSQIGLRLMEELFDDNKYSQNLVAAYLIGWGITEDDIKDKPWIKMATEESDTGCVISFSSEAPDIDSSFVVPAETKSLSINPLNWKTDGTVANAIENNGACFTDYGGNIVTEIPNLTGAYLDATRGTLKVTDINSDEYPPILDLFETGEYHLYDYQFFYRNLQENVKNRIDAYNKNS